MKAILILQYFLTLFIMKTESILALTNFVSFKSNSFICFWYNKFILFVFNLNIFGGINHLFFYFHCYRLCNIIIHNNLIDILSFQKNFINYFCLKFYNKI